jgi:Type I phosphodiesterase / nucleotide pyrophosphatase
MRRFIVCAVAALAMAALPGDASAQRRTRNVILIVTDGLRWQEVFGGAERALISSRAGGVRDTTRLLADFWRDTPAARRQALLPFIWGTIAREGVLYGNRARGSDAHITNPLKFSYPGYNELFTGAYDPRIDSNDYPPNPNETVFEWLNGQPDYTGRVGAVATWDAFRRILNRERSGMPVHDGWDRPFARHPNPSDRMRLVDELYATSVHLWANNAFDAPMHLTAKEFIRDRTPRVLFLGYGETDEWAHAGMYDLLLRSAHQVDAFIADLWATLQATPHYRDSTTLIITTDHGRGSGPERWRDHGKEVDGAEHIWLAMIGPDTPALGERAAGPVVTQSQVAATIAALLGEDWLARRPGAGAPLAEAIRGRH